MGCECAALSSCADAINFDRPRHLFLFCVVVSRASDTHHTPAWVRQGSGDSGGTGRDEREREREKMVEFYYVMYKDPFKMGEDVYSL